MSNLPAGLTAGTWNVDASHSDFAFTVRHAGVTKVRGNLYGIEGSVVFGDDFESTSVQASADATTISTNNEQRDGHLQSADFFLAGEHPRVSFTSTSVSNFDGETFDLAGDLNIRGVSKAVTFKAEFNGSNEDPYGNTVAGFSATASINRKDFGMEFNATVPGGDLLVGDKVKIDIELEVVKQD